MFNSFFGKRSGNVVRVRNINNESSNSNFALLEFRGDICNKILQQFTNHYLTEGDHIKNGGKCSPKNILSLAGTGVGSLGLTHLASGSLYMATADPAKLMVIGSGFGSAVMGNSGIVAQAPFIPVGGAMFAVAAPLLVCSTLSSIMMLNQFERVNAKLDSIRSSVERVLQRNEATIVGTIASAIARLKDIKKQFEICNQFTDSMLIRLALLEDSVNPLLKRSRYLRGLQKLNKSSSQEDISFRKWDSRLAVLTSILDMQIDVLRLKVCFQENPGVVSFATRRLYKKVSSYQKMYEKIRKESIRMQEISVELNEANKSMNSWQWNAPWWLLGKREERNKNNQQAAQFNKASYDHRQEFEKILPNQPIRQEGLMDLVYWRDEQGEHSYYTDDLGIQDERK